MAVALKIFLCGFLLLESVGGFVFGLIMAYSVLLPLFRPEMQTSGSDILGGVLFGIGPILFFSGTAFATSRLFDFFSFGRFLKIFSSIIIFAISMLIGNGFVLGLLESTPEISIGGKIFSIIIWWFIPAVLSLFLLRSGIIVPDQIYGSEGTVRDNGPSNNPS